MNTEVLICLQCKNQFQKKRQKHKFCRQDCRRKYWTQRHKRMKDLISQVIGLLREIEQIA